MTEATRPRFHVSGVATIKHINIRKEGDDSEKVIAVDVKLSFEKLPRAVLAYFDPDGVLPAFLWRGDPATDALIVRSGYLLPLNYLHEIDGAHITIGSACAGLGDAKKFSLAPRDGGLIDLTCSVSIYPTSKEVADLAKNVQDGAWVEIEGLADLFDGAAGVT